MANSLAVAYITVAAETSGIPRQIRSAFGSAQRDADTAGRNSGRSFASSFGSNLKGLGAAAGVTGGIAGVAVAMKSAISSGMDFTNSLNTMQAVAGASASQVAEVGKMARQLGTDNSLAATSSVDAAQAMLELAKGGFTVDQSMQAARGTLQLAAAAQISAGEAATIQSQALQAFGQNATFAGTASDILANAANQSSAEITDVAQALQQSGTVANQFGISMNDTAAAISLMANSGIKGSDAGTLLKSALLALTDQGKPAQTAMEELGITAYDAQGKFVGLSSLFGQLQTASKGMSAEQYQAATSVLFGSDAMRIAGIAAQQGKTGFDSMSAAMGKQGAAADVAKAKMQGLPGAWEKFQNSAQDAGLAFYDVVKGPLASAASWGADAIESITSTAGKIGPALAGVFAGVPVAIGGVRDAFNSLSESGKLDEWGDRLVNVFTGLWGVAQELQPAIMQLGEIAAKAGGTVLYVGWEAFLATLETVESVLQTVAPLISGITSFLSDNKTAVIGLTAAYVGFRIATGFFGNLRTGFASVAAGTTAATRNVTGATGAIQRMGMAAGTATGRITGVTGAVRGFIATNTALTQGSGASQARLMQLAGVAQASNGRFQTLTGQFISNATAQERMANAGRNALPAMGRFGTAIQQIGDRSPAVNRMQTSFVNAASGAQQFGRTAGIAAAAGSGLRSAGAGIAGVFGGPVGLALTGAVIAGGAWASTVQKQKGVTDAYKGALSSLAEEQKNTNSLLMQSRGATTESVYASLTKQVDAYKDSLTSASANDGKWTDTIKDLFSNPLSVSDDDFKSTQMDQAATQARQTQEALNKLGLTSDDIGRKVAGSGGQWEAFHNSLMRGDEGAQTAGKSLQGLRDKYLQQQDVARRVTPGVTELGDAMRVMGDKGSSAGDKLNALKTAMDAMNPARNQTEAVAQYGESVRKVAEAVSNVDGTGINPTAFNKSGQLDAMSESGAKLSRTLADLADKSAQVAAGGDLNAIGAVAKQNETAFQQLATATGRSVDEIKALYGSLGGTAVDLSVSLQGAPEVTQQLAAISTQWNKTPDKKTIEVQESAVNEQTRTALQQMNINVSKPMNGIVTITANDTVAQSRILLVQKNLSVLAAMKVNPNIDMNTLEFQAKDQQTRGALQQLAGMNPTPKAGMVIQDLLNGQAVSMARLDELSRTTANPQAKLLIDAIMANIKTVNDGLDQITRTRVANIVAKIGPGAGDAPDLAQMTPEQRRALGYADGGIRAYANGGINALESYANGKLPTQAVIQKAQPNSLVQWAEPETGGEAFIPLAGGKRGRSTSILASVAQMFGFDLVPQGNLPGTASGMAGALGGGALSGLLARTGIDRMYKFAAGGVTAEGLKALAQGTGASRPLTGAPYVWGGTNWGDCSGAMSAFARMAAGLDPFGGRFSTATMGAQLASMGFTMGRGKSGDLRFGWHNGGPGGGHTSGTLPDDTAIEMGGGNGGGMLGGGAANADSPQHTDHAYMTIGQGYSDAGSDPGGFVVRPDGTIAFQAGNGNFSAGGSAAGTGSGATAAGGTSLSTRLGSVAGSFIEGQIASMLSVLSVNDSPGALAAIAEYENQVKASQSGSGSAVDTSALKKSYETAKAEADNRYEAEKLKRQQEYEAERKKLQDQQQATKDRAKRADLERKLEDLKTKYQNDNLAAKQKHDDASLQAKQKFDEVKKTGASANSAAAAQGAVTDPGSSLPKKGQDLGGGAAAGGGGSIKDAFKSGLRDAWRVGQPWVDSDWIVNKESSWNPAARNGKYFGLIQAGPEVYAAAGKSPTTTDPKDQGQVFDKYVGDRYQDPMRARAHHQANNWYDQGGAAIGTGLMAKNVLAPERVLSPRQTAAFEGMVQRDFQGGGGTGALEEKFDRLIDLMGKRPPLVPVVVPDEAGRRRVERDRTVQRHLVSK